MIMEGLNQGPNFKNFWKTDEGKWGKIALLALVGGAGLAVWYKLLPFLSKIVWGTVELGVGLAIIGAVALVVTNTQIRESISALFKIGVRALRNFVLRLDPIGIMKDQIEERKTKLASAEQQFEKLEARMTEVQRLYDKNEEDRKTARAAALAAGQLAAKHPEGSDEREAYLREQIIKAEEAQGLDMFDKKLLQQLENMRKYKKVLRKFQSYTEFVIRRKETRLRLLEMNMKQAKATFGILRTLQEVWKGKSSDEAMYRDAEDVAETQIADMFGAVDNFMDQGSGIIAQIDVEQGASAAQALDSLARQAEELMNQPALKQITSEVPNGVAVEETSLPTPATRKSGMGATESVDPMERFLKG